VSAQGDRGAAYANRHGTADYNVSCEGKEEIRYSAPPEISSDRPKAACLWRNRNLQDTDAGIEALEGLLRSARLEASVFPLHARDCRDPSR
jgi:hypothetical protein